MLFSTRTSLESIFGGPRTAMYAVLTIITLVFGGFVLGPMVQKYAFDAYWTGWPFGHDLTDNKTAIALLFWIVAYWRIRKQSSPKYWAIMAGVALILVFLIPHSMLGSELDYSKMPTP
jgi:hypothetical protein